MILPNLSGIESAFGEDLSGIEPANREDESRIESSSGVDFSVTKKRKKPSNNQTAKNKSAPYLKQFFNHGFHKLVINIILNLILPNLCRIESASGEDLSGIEPPSGEDESGEDESGIEYHSGSGAGMF